MFRNIKQVIYGVALFAFTFLYASELKAVNPQQMIEAIKVDKHALESLKVEWIDISFNEGRLVSFFEEATIITYFKKTNKKCFFHSVNPIKQEFLYHPTQQLFTSVDFELRLWDDGVSGYSFRYKNMCLNDQGRKFDSAFVTINDACGVAPFESRYTLHAKGG